MKKLLTAAAVLVATLPTQAADVTVTVSGEMSSHDVITTFISFQFAQTYGVNDPSLPISNIKVTGSITYDADTFEVSALSLTQAGVAELGWFANETVTLSGLSWTYDPVTGALNQDGTAFADCVDTVSPMCSPFGVGGWQNIANNDDSFMDFDTIPVGYLLGGARVYETENPMDGNSAIFDFSDIGAGNIGARFYGNFNLDGSSSGDEASRAEFSLVATPVDDTASVAVPVPGVALLVGAGLLGLIGAKSKKKGQASR